MRGTKWSGKRKETKGTVHEWNHLIEIHSSSKYMACLICWFIVTSLGILAISLFSESQETFIWLLALLNRVRISLCLVCCAKGIKSHLPSIDNSTSS